MNLLRSFAYMCLFIRSLKRLNIKSYDHIDLLKILHLVRPHICLEAKNVFLQPQILFVESKVTSIIYYSTTTFIQEALDTLVHEGGE